MTSKSCAKRWVGMVSAIMIQIAFMVLFQDVARQVTVPFCSKFHQRFRNHTYGRNIFDFKLCVLSSPTNTRSQQMFILDFVPLEDFLIRECYVLNYWSIYMPKIKGLALKIPNCFSLCCKIQFPSEIQLIQHWLWKLISLFLLSLKVLDLLNVIVLFASFYSIRLWKCFGRVVLW